MHYKKRLNVSSWIFCGVAALLFVIAGLQYRWISEVSRAEQERLKENLRLAMNRFVQDFERDFFHPSVVAARTLGAAERNDRESNFAADAAARVAWQYDAWTASSRYPGLLQDLFVTRTSSENRVDLLRYDSPARKLVPSEWPPELLGFRDFCLAQFKASEQAPVKVPNLDDVPAIILPFGPPAPAEVPEWEIARIDAASFELFLSHLVERNFPRQGDFDYDILIVSKPSERIVYRSSPGLDAETFQKTADANIAVDGPVAMALSGGGFARGFRGRGSSVTVRVTRTAPMRLYADPGPVEESSPGWRLYAKHHSGSLETFASQFRIRNLMVSSAAFGLLILGIALAFVSAQRIRAMGKLQLEFAAGLSHELRTPLTVIRSAGYNMVQGNIVSRKEVARYGTVIEQEGTRLSEIVEQALLFAQIQSGRRQYERHPVPVRPMIESVVASCRGLLLKYPCEIISSIAPDLPVVTTDENALGQCIRNLVVNALKYSERDGRIEICARALFLTRIAEIEISIVNRGRCIDRDEMPHIFEPFFRGRNAGGTPGNGLGLYMVHSIMSALGGRITATSSGDETRFFLYLPAAGMPGK